MKVLACHNYYQQRGGEDQSCEDEVALLRRGGDEVVTYTRHNDEVDGMSKLSVAKQTLWSRRSSREIRLLVADHRPDVVHFTNTFPLISPSVYGEARRLGAAVVQSLRNYRMACAGPYFLRGGKVCEDCLGKAVPWPAVVHRCYRGSLAGSAVVAGMQTGHRLLGTWKRGVDLFYTLTDFAREKCVATGLPPDRVLVKPNCVQPDPGPAAGRGGYAVFVGRLSPEKGVGTLLDAWRRLSAPGAGGGLRLKVVGGGQLAARVAAAARENPNIVATGPLAHDEMLRVVGDARALIMPSVWYETFGRTIIEAYAKGTPVIASRLGAMSELVSPGETGLLFEPGEAESLAGAVAELWSLPAERTAAMRAECRSRYLERYTPEQNYKLLKAVYAKARELREARGAAAGRLENPGRSPGEAPRAETPQLR
ncbi:MAG: glycosyltransferase [Planctomycetota bacterium]